MAINRSGYEDMLTSIPGSFATDPNRRTIMPVAPGTARVAPIRRTIMPVAPGTRRVRPI